jgi:uncharacterized protein YkwD
VKPEVLWLGGLVVGAGAVVGAVALASKPVGAKPSSPVAASLPKAPLPNLAPAVAFTRPTNFITRAAPSFYRGGLLPPPQSQPITPAPVPLAGDSLQQHNLQVVNAYRSRLGVAPLILDIRLSSFAMAGSQQLSQDHIPHQHIRSAVAAGTLFNPENGFAQEAGENQGSPVGWPPEDETQQIDEALAMMFAEGPGQGEEHGHYMNIVNPRFTRLGVGLLLVGGRLYMTNDFSS